MATVNRTVELSVDEITLVGDALGLLVDSAKRSKKQHIKDEVLHKAFHNKELRIQQLISKIDSFL